MLKSIPSTKLSGSYFKNMFREVMGFIVQNTKHRIAFLHSKDKGECMNSGMDY